MLGRRNFVAGAGALVFGLAVGSEDVRAAEQPTIAMMGTPKGDETWFDPIGLWVPVGTTIRWFTPADQTQKHATAAYHPVNRDSPQRIPKQAKPWNSGYIGPGEMFEVALTEAGVYDYYCLPHEAAGMVGRIVVGLPTGRELMDFDRDTAAHPEWRVLPKAALQAFPSVEDILAKKTVPYRRG
ncbi:plastocyanin/azurin family copper-binding protein [Telmatospirillum sp.]|uniref:plastocyanin/azurin family copper-binding protein n=1 Tax=Telmatospirillum sp. TaxID=2079197 RepID=UPI00284A3D41|nr:plastocyanin/azurin family copper-binding protein [Telmatospirillum sp.]MDR3438818.1 plastocyanin/azurin family copper-binding protein [Telmatospirillum sp.]